MDGRARAEEAKRLKIAAAEEERKRQQAIRERQQQQQRAIEAERRRKRAQQQHAAAAKRSKTPQEPPPPPLPALPLPIPPALHVDAWSPDDDRRLLRALRAWGRCPLSDAEWQELPCLPVRWQSCRDRAAALYARAPDAKVFVKGSSYDNGGRDLEASEGEKEERLNAIVRSVHDDASGASMAPISPQVKAENEAWKRLGLEAERMGAAMRDAFPNGEMSVGTISIGEAAFALACAACGDKDAGAGLDGPSAGLGMPFDAMTASAVVVSGAQLRPGPFAFLDSRVGSTAAVATSVIDAADTPAAVSSSLRSLAVGVLMHRPGCEENEAVRHMMDAHGSDATASACLATLTTLVGEGLLERDEATVSGMSFVFYHAHPLAPLRLGTSAPPRVASTT